MLAYIAEITNDFKSLNSEIRTLLQPYRLDDFSLDELKEIDDEKLTEANKHIFLTKRSSSYDYCYRGLKTKNNLITKKYDSILLMKLKIFQETG